LNRHLVKIFLISVSAGSLFAGGPALRLEVDLSGTWRFEVGDDPRYAQPGFRTDNWETIQVPSLWENQGFPGYDGFAWYRIELKIPKSLKHKPLYLRLGRIDDSDRTYWNGKLIGGEGELPPDFKSAWDMSRLYRIPEDDIRFDGTNVVAIRVYDVWWGGGIVEGPVGVYSADASLEFMVCLAGTWKFTTGDDPKWASPDFNDTDWKTLEVPAYWESQGCKDYDGFAWYRRSVFVPRCQAGSRTVLVMGRIDDSDQTFLNGVLIGRTGVIEKSDPEDSEGYRRFRAYDIPPDLLRRDKPNVIAVRVLDTGMGGGLYDGPIGIMTRDQYLKIAGTVKR
jgi:hypothetical protein